LIVHHADWVLPISGPPVRNGWVAIENHRIAGCGAGAAPEGTPVEHDRVAILPALVNAHTHIELSWMRDRVPPSDRFDSWIRALVALRRRHPNPATLFPLDAAREAIREARASGTCLFGDISNTLETVPLFAEIGSSAQVFHELIGFNAGDPDDLVRRARERLMRAENAGGDVRTSLAPHAPYTVSPALFRSIRDHLDAAPDRLSSVHLGESPEEIEFLRSGSGPIRTALEALGAWNPEWAPPASGPVEYLARLGFLQPRVLIVHGVQLTDDEIRRVSEAKATIVTCPRSNRWTGAGTPPISRFYALGVRVAVGTDSLASVEDLNLFAEMATVRRLAPDVAAPRILESATRVGAEALGFGEELGTIAPGKRADLIAVRIPGDVQDVEEYLLTGISPADVGWVNPEPEP
jgi:cytosine/adenosine deaminase-related metal-dependent hydrolase